MSEPLIKCGCVREHYLREAIMNRNAEIERLTAEYSDLRELAEKFVDAWLGDNGSVELDGIAASMAAALSRD